MAASTIRSHYGNILEEMPPNQMHSVTLLHVPPFTSECEPNRSSPQANPLLRQAEDASPVPRASL